MNPEDICFGGIPREFTDYNSARVVVLPIPYEATTTYLKGTQHGPRELLLASRALEFYDEELDWEPYKVGIHTVSSLPVEGRPFEVVEDLIVSAATSVLAQGKFPVAIGGEHTITVGMVKGVRSLYPDLTVVQLDAHADLRSQYNGDPYSHACVMRRVREMCPAVQLGLRALDAEEVQLARKEGWPIVLDIEMKRDPSRAHKLLRELRGAVYLTLDLDALDPAVMPAVGTPEPGGFGWYELLDLLKRIFEGCHIVAADIVELCPRPGLEASTFTAAKLLYKIIGYRFSRIVPQA